MKAILYSLLLASPLHALTLAWNPNPETNIINYEIAWQERVNGVYENLVYSRSFTNGATSFFIPQRLNEETTFWVSAVDPDGQGQWSAPLIFDPSTYIDKMKTANLTVVFDGSTYSSSMNISGGANQSFTVQVSTDLVIWTNTTSSTTNTSGFYSFNYVSTEPKLFFRVKY